MRFAFEWLAKLWMRDRDHATDTLDQRLAAQFSGAELGHDNIGVTARGGDRTGEASDDAAELAVSGGRRHRDNGSSAFGELRTAHEIHLPSDRTDINARCHFGIDLSGQVSLDRGVYCDYAPELAEHLRPMRVH
jgi:hypothetical protein